MKRFYCLILIPLNFGLAWLQKYYPIKSCLVPNIKVVIIVNFIIFTVMLSILNAIELSTEYLSKKGVESPRINAELLLADILKCNRMELYLKFDQPLSNAEVSDYREYIKRRGKREPLQYITGSVEFYGLEFIVNKNVLIPRQETELLVEKIILDSKKEINLRILDVGTGSGNIAISLAKNLPNSIITSVDINNNALKIARENSLLNNTDKQISFINEDIKNFKVSSSEKFDLIVSNPPYIKLQDYSNLEIELRNFEPKNALTDKNDGLTFYRIISEKAGDLLNNNGKLYFEMGYQQSEQISEIMTNKGFKNLTITKDYQNIDRIISGVRN